MTRGRCKTPEDEIIKTEKRRETSQKRQEAAIAFWKKVKTEEPEKYAILVKEGRKCRPFGLGTEEQEFRREVFEKEGKYCKMCGSTEQLHIHHIKSRVEFPGLKYSIDNAMVLCHVCHKKVHKSKKYDNLNISDVFRGKGKAGDTVEVHTVYISRSEGKIRSSSIVEYN